MRLWQREEEEHQARLALIRERLERSANSGKPVPLDQAFEQTGNGSSAEAAGQKQRVRPAYLHICVYARLEAFQTQHQRFEGESNPRTPVV